MLKKRGKLRAMVLLSLGIIVLILFIALFLGYNGKKEAAEKQYALNAEELANLSMLMDNQIFSYYAECGAFAKKDENLCNLTPKENDRNNPEGCFEYISMIKAKKESNPNYCKNISSEEIRHYCAEYLTGNIDCSKIDISQKQLCLAVAGVVKTKNVSFCEKVAGQDNEDCKSSAGLLVTIDNENAQACNQLPQGYQNEYCLAWLTGNLSVCKKFEPDMNDILKSLAVLAQNERICSLVNKTKVKELCYLEFAAKDKKVCDLIFTKDFNLACTGIITKDKAMCNNVQDEAAKIDCNENA